MVERVHRGLRYLSRWGVVITLGLGVVMCFSAPVWSQPKKRQGEHWGSYQGSSPEGEAGFNKKMQRWKSLPPEKQKTLRHRMEQWMELSPEERTLYEQRFDQWKKLSPEERRMIREKLEKWNGLPPQDREKILQKFRTP